MVEPVLEEAEGGTKGVRAGLGHLEAKTAGGGGRGGGSSSSNPILDKSEEEAREEDEADLRQEEEEDWDHLGHEPALEDVFEGLKLHGEEEEDLDLSGEVEELIKEVRWLCLFRVHTMRPFSHAALLNSLRNA